MRSTQGKIVTGVLVAMILAAGVATAVVVTATRLPASGRTRVTLEGSSASWNPFVQVYDGSFSALLESDATTTSHVDFSPLRIPLNTVESRFTFWAYWQTGHEIGGHLWVPHLELVLDNGRWLTSDQNTQPVGGTVADLTVAGNTEDGQGYPSADLWTQMEVASCTPVVGGPPSSCGFFSDFAANDPCIPDTWDIDNPHNLADWASTAAGMPGALCPTFPQARIVQARISFGGDGAAHDDIIYIDNAILGGRPVRIEPETAP